ncbi:MAG: class I SAM-dependent methyltransferase [Bacillota bacterium]|nr:class I SAM-dependent methyltransferase [Bacillota bacterium]
MEYEIPIPPENFIKLIGYPGYKEVGETFFGYFKDLCGLQPEEKLLEIGCGVGRMAVPLTRYLKDGGEYIGIDIVKDFIDWNRQNITTRFPNFNFVWADIQNRFYNPAGFLKDEVYLFPFQDQTFDMVILISVFTHMLEEGFFRYVSEVSRLLRPGGRCFATFFMLNPLQAQLYKQGKNQIDFSISHGVCKTVEGIPESVVSYPEDYVKQVFTSNGLQVREPVYYGWWSGREDFISFQDMLVAVKEG